MTAALIVLAILVLIPLAFMASLVRFDRPAADVEARRAGASSRFADVEGLRVHYTDVGSGPPIVLIHGINSNHASFAGWQRELSSSYRTIALDLPGHGLTGPDAKDRYSWREMAEVVEGLVTSIGLECFVLAGNSLGGAVSMEYAIAHPERLEALVLIDSIGPPFRGKMPPSLAAMRRPLLGPFLSLLSPPMVVKQVLESTFGDPSRLPPSAVEIATDLVLREGNRKAARQVLLKGGDQGLGSRLGAVRCPVLILWGDKDTWTTPDNIGWFTTHFPRAQLVRYPELGHLPMTEDSARTAQSLRDFLDTIPGYRLE